MVLEGRVPTVGMPSEVFVQLQEMLVPKWDRAWKGRPIGCVCYVYVDDEPEEETEEDDDDNDEDDGLDVCVIS